MIGNAFLLAFRELRRNKMRSFLTMLGIIIGVAAVITLVTLGGGATLEEAAEKLHLKLIKVAAIDNKGLGADGNPVAGKDVSLASDRDPADTISAASGPSIASGVAMFLNAYKLYPTISSRMVIVARPMRK